MKTTEELNALKEEIKILNKKLAELTEDELIQVAGGEDEPEVGNWFCPRWFKRVSPSTCKMCDRKDNCSTYKKHQK